MHITLEKSGNQSIIYIRDFQQVMFFFLLFVSRINENDPNVNNVFMNLAQVEIEKGQAMLDIFKNYVWMTTLLNEFTLRVELLLRRPRSSQGRHRQQEEEEYHADEAAEDEADKE